MVVNIWYAPLAPMIGRDDDVAVLTDLLSAHRLVSVVGPGGVGKTLLATETVAAVADRYADGVRIVELAALRDSSLVVEEICSAVGLPRTGGRDRLGALTDWIADHTDLLIVLDNCEHVLSRVAVLARELLRSAPGLQMLTTSREPLSLPGESVVWLTPLPVPPKDASPEEIPAYSSVSLFVDRAHARDQRFEVDGERWLTVAEICRRLDGLPLALELAAGRVAAIGLDTVADRLAQGRPLSGRMRGVDERHTTLMSVFEWSESLLDESERVLLRRLSLFAGGFDIDAAAGVLAAAGWPVDDVEDALARLVERSLLVHDVAGERFSMLETIRQFATNRLEEADRLAQAHARWYLAWAVEAGAGLSAGPEREWVQRMTAAEDNIRIALAWALENEPLNALAAAAVMPLFWWLRSQHREGIGWLRQGLERAEDAPPELRAAALFGLGFLWAHDTDDWAGSTEYLDQGIALVDDDAPPPILGYLLCLRGEADSVAGQYESAIAATRRGLAILDDQPDPWGQAFAVWNVGHVLQLAGDLAGAQECYERMVAIQTEHGSRLELMIGLNSLGELAEHRGDFDRALELFGQALQMRQELGAVRLGYVHGSLARSLLAVARVSVAAGDREAARAALAEAVPVAEQMRDAETLDACRTLADVLDETPTAARLRRDGSGWTVAFGDEQGHLADAKGVRHLHALLSRPHQPVSALTLAGLADGLRREDTDAGPMLDDAALRAYRRRLDELEAECDLADRTGDADRMRAADDERAALIAELSRATGLGGRTRRAGSEVERARLNVTRTLRDAITRIEAQCPELTAHLNEAVITGTQCVYQPQTPVAWQL